MGNPVVHFEVNGPQGADVATFYSELFGWDVQVVEEMNYATVDTRSGPGINGGFGQTCEGQPARVTFYAGADDLQAVLDRAESLGGKTIMPPTQVSEGTAVALFQDPQGTSFGLFKTTTP